jgi:S-adenosylmethionine:tRNA ribosyltransferase-isomerase
MFAFFEQHVMISKSKYYTVPNMHYNHIDHFDFALPEALIAQYPTAERAASRLLAVDIPEQRFFHQQFPDFLSWMQPHDIVVLNDTKVIPARLFGKKASGGQLECLIERVLSADTALAQLRSSKPAPLGSQIFFQGGFSATVLERHEDLFHLQFIADAPLLTLLYQHGSIPLPLYCKRPCEAIDFHRYQTIYAKHPGAVAAPTAGLHFDADLLSKLTAQGVSVAYVTLHIGAGTFQPVRVEWLDQHQMHTEYMEISEATCEAIHRCRERGGRVFAVGTTVARCLETAQLKPYSGDTQLFIRPGFQFQCIDALLTNFHTPKSTLLMLVTAFGGYELVMKAYQTAIEQRYRFFSYGDAMLLLKSK